MKVLLVIQHPAMPSSRVRVLSLVPDLRAAGLDAAVLPYPSTWGGRRALLAAARAAHVVLLQKKLPAPLDAWLLRRFSRRLLYDFDDAVYYRHESRGSPEHPTSRRKFRGIVRRADLVLAGNRILAAEAAKLGARVEILPSTVETRGVPVRDHGAASGPFVVGWIGTEINLGQAALLGPVLRRLAQDVPLELRIISGRGLDLPGVTTRFVPWSAETQAAELARLDAGVMPLPRSPHAEGKCGYKALQYMAAGVPPVVSDVGVNREIVEDGACGLVARDLDDFEPALRRLASDPLRRAALGRAARGRVEAAYSVAGAAARLAAILRAEGGGA